YPIQSPILIPCSSGMNFPFRSGVASGQKNDPDWRFSLRGTRNACKSEGGRDLTCHSQKDRFFQTLPDTGASSIKIQQPIQPNILETVSRLPPHHRLSVIRDRNAGLGHHREVVGAVAEGDDLIAR